MTDTTTRPNPLLWLDDHRGVYIPRDFANCFRDRAKVVEGVSDEDWAILEAGPDHELYWDTWNDVCDTAIVTDENGVKFRLHQDGALWLIPDGMEYDEQNEFFAWPEAETE